MLTKPCRDCSFPGLMVENLDVYMLIAQSSSVMMDGMGGINLANVKQVAEVHLLPWNRSIINKLLAYFAILIEKQQEGQS